jgi:hypothetical protein
MNQRFKMLKKTDRADRWWGRLTLRVGKPQQNITVQSDTPLSRIESQYGCSAPTYHIEACLRIVAGSQACSAENIGLYSAAQLGCFSVVIRYGARAEQQASAEPHNKGIFNT